MDNLAHVVPSPIRTFKLIIQDWYNDVLIVETLINIFNNVKKLDDLRNK